MRPLSSSDIGPLPEGERVFATGTAAVLKNSDAIWPQRAHKMLILRSGVGQVKL